MATPSKNAEKPDYPQETEADLRGATVALCGRFRSLIERVIVAGGDKAAHIREMQRTIEGFGDELQAYEELFEGRLPQARDYGALPTGELYREFWAAAETYRPCVALGPDLLDPVLELERRELRKPRERPPAKAGPDSAKNE